MLQELLLEKNLPALPPLTDAAARDAARRLLAEQEYGVTPAFAGTVSPFVESEEAAYGGAAVRQRIRLTFPTPAGLCSFPFQLLLPKDKEKVPVFLHVCFAGDSRRTTTGSSISEHVPEEEILAAGYGLALLQYEDVTSDSGALDGLARAYPIDPAAGWGKIGMWAFAASRVLDHLLTRPQIDPRRISVSGWSRLGKTALWCGAQDERFSLVISNESGCSGAALTRGKVGEHVRDITSRFPFWFCRNYHAYAEREDALPFDQHLLLSLIAPRALFVASAEEDSWADPHAEFLAAAAASPAYAAAGVDGLVTPDAWPAADAPLLDGRIGYWMRTGRHALLLSDWMTFIAFREKHGV